VRAGVARFLFALGVLSALSLLCACAGTGSFASAEMQSSGDWNIERETDRVTGEALTEVWLKSSQISHPGLPAIPHALLEFACLKGQLLVRLQFGFQVGSKADSDVSYRFDDKQSHSVEARMLRGLKIVVIEKEGEVAQFTQGLATANVLYVVINSLAKGRTVAEFEVAGAPPAIAAAHAACH
jgi:hypothetical protein